MMMMMLDQSAAVWSTVAFAAAALDQSAGGLADVPVPIKYWKVPAKYLPTVPKKYITY